MPSTPGTKRGDTDPRPCANTDLDLFFPAEDSASYTKPNDQERAAQAVCARCPFAAKATCLENALRLPAKDQWGVAGGATAAQRRTIIRGREAARMIGVAA
ncbi:WhiB family transcriptional regulator [Kitasatospora purpeofusca]|uniref:WhiB family transcriptional regulator n=1 Tax=Kitasatospora purpeofusca TaxID=67352 RepID=UPI00380C5058